MAAGHQCVAVTSGARAYETGFARYHLNVAQLLLTHGDLDSQMRRTNAKNTLERLLAACNVVPIINENDSVAVEELEFGDNDLLSVDVAALAGADLLILLTQVDGLLDSDGQIVRRVRDIERVKNLVSSEKGRFSVGGMVSKLDAVQIAIDAGIAAVIINGRQLKRIAAVVAGEEAGTHFVAKKRSRASQNSLGKASARHR